MPPSFTHNRHLYPPASLVRGQRALCKCRLEAVHQLYILELVWLYMPQDDSVVVWMTALVLQLWHPLGLLNKAETKFDDLAERSLRILSQMAALQSSYFLLASSQVQQRKLLDEPSLLDRLYSLLACAEPR